MKDHRDRRAGLGARSETAFETAFGAGKNDFGHGILTRELMPPMWRERLRAI
jgi:hypothetical protein